MNWHERFAQWARPASETEEESAARSARMVREALREDATLASRDFDVVAMGSYRNNTNVRAASDVDLAAVFRGAIFPAYPADGSLDSSKLGFANATYGLNEFRADVNRALAARFGSAETSPGRIALTIDSGSSRLGADVTPFLVHRRYTGKKLADGRWHYLEGIESRPLGAPSRRLIHWPEQHYSEGVAKNQVTNRRYKRVVRILKHLRDEMRENHSPEQRGLGREIESCFIEHSVFNAPDDRFNRDPGTYYEDVKAVILWLLNAARNREQTDAMVEVNRLQKLFRADVLWSAGHMERFCLAAWRTFGFT